MNKPRWQLSNGGGCQWPRCQEVGQVRYSYGATKWIELEDGVDLCDEHNEIMSRELFPNPEGPTVGTKLWLKATEDYPREQVTVLDWWYMGEVIVLTADGEVTYTEFEHETA